MCRWITIRYCKCWGWRSTLAAGKYTVGARRPAWRQRNMTFSIFWWWTEDRFSLMGRYIRTCGAMRRSEGRTMPWNVISGTCARSCSRRCRMPLLRFGVSGKSGTALRWAKITRYLWNSIWLTASSVQNGMPMSFWHTSTLYRQWTRWKHIVLWHELMISG